MRRRSSGDDLGRWLFLMFVLRSLPAAVGFVLGALMGLLGPR